ncbi:MAG: DUF4091 domain-containing protein [Clostridia bacterium]|nr:DUF4091 domain-containing protein [Clostridia bacterium]
MIETGIFSSLTAIFPDKEPTDKQMRRFYMCKNQAINFQLAFKITDNSCHSTDFFIRVDSVLPVTLYYQNCVPVLNTSLVDTDMPTGLYPDILLPKKTNPVLVCFLDAGKQEMYTEKGESVSLRAYDDSWQALWFCVNEFQKPLKAGEYEIKLALYDIRNEKVGEDKIAVEVLVDKLPVQKLMYTNWFHHDCLADTYNVPVFSDRYFEIMKDYVEKAARNGMNMILLPAFTPPLDTPPGGERMTVQLVQIIKSGSNYSFDFSLMKRFIDICKKAGIRYFEHVHLFTQWGAAAAPKIIVTENGKEKKMFGWHTKATGKKYHAFLKQYLTAVKAFFEREKLTNRVMFHISDEPNYGNIESYKAARQSVIDMLKGYLVSDAMSCVAFYEQGLCDMPIAGTSHVHDFIGKCKNLWAYYIGGDVNGGKANRIIPLQRERNRVMGMHLYYFAIKGFLHWGYNNYYGIQSQYLFNPALNPSGGFALAGTSYFVYPAMDGTAYQSIRQKLFAEALNDIRLLSLLEKKIGKAETKQLAEKHFGTIRFDRMPQNAQSYLDFIEDVYKHIQA